MFKTKLIVAFMLACAVSSVVGVAYAGKAEEVGKAIDDAGARAQQKTGEAMEKTGQEIEKAGQDLQSE